MESNKGFFRGSDELLTAINEVILGYSTSSNAALQHVAPLTCGARWGGSFLHAYLAFWRSVRDVRFSNMRNGAKGQQTG